jgi:DNA polymerase III epsilon subunit-like protein
MNLREGFSPFNLNNPNPLADIDVSKICYFDTETTGINPAKSQIVEIAAMKGDDQFYEKIFLTDETKNKIKQEENNLIKGGKRDKKIEELLQMSDYYNEKVNPSSTELEALLKFKDFVEDAEFLLAHNASFDMKMVNTRLKIYNQQPIRGITVLDSLAFSRRFFIPALVTFEKTNPNKETRARAKEILDKITKSYYESGQRRMMQSSLGALTSALIGQMENWHQALNDVSFTKQLVEDFFKLFMDKHIKSEYGFDVRSKPTFKEYFLRNKRFEDRLKR